MEKIIRVEDVIASSYIAQYKEEVNIIAHQLIFAHNALVILRKIAEFPFDFFLGKYEKTFWILTQNTYFRSIILSLSHINSNNGDDYYRLSNLANRIERKFKKTDISQETLQLYRDKKKKIKFNKRIEELKTKLSTIRNKYIAHIDPDFVNKVESFITLTELESIVKISKELLDVLCFEEHFHLEYWNYTPRPIATNYEIDIDQIFKGIVRESYWFNDDIGLHFSEYRVEEFKKLPLSEQKMLIEWQEKLKLNIF